MPAAVDQIPDSSRRSVSASPVRMSAAKSEPDPEPDPEPEPEPDPEPAPNSTARPVSRSWRLIQRTTWSTPPLLTAAAWRRGARSASARSVQWLPSAGHPGGRTAAPAAPAMARAVRSAVSQFRQAGTGDHRSGVTPDGSGVLPDGSNSQHRPMPALASRVASNTSTLVDVDTTAPGAQRTLGMTTVLVLPDRGGPSTSTACCGGAKAAPAVPAPRYRGRSEERR